MSRDSVKYGRIPKKQKARMIQDRKEQWYVLFFRVFRFLTLVHSGLPRKCK